MPTAAVSLELSRQLLRTIGLHVRNRRLPRSAADLSGLRRRRDQPGLGLRRARPLRRNARPARFIRGTERRVRNGTAARAGARVHRQAQLPGGGRIWTLRISFRRFISVVFAEFLPPLHTMYLYLLRRCLLKSVAIVKHYLKVRPPPRLFPTWCVRHSTLPCAASLRKVDAPIHAMQTTSRSQLHDVDFLRPLQL
jgi:hypothetical protein